MTEYSYDSLASVGSNSYISALVDIKRPRLVSIGNNVAIDSWFYCTVNLRTGDYVHIAPHVSVIGGQLGNLEMGHFTNLAAGCRIVCASDRFNGDGLIGAFIPEPFKDTVIASTIKISNFANLGTNVVVMPGVTIAEGSVIGACSLVTESTEPWTIYVGVPAKPIKIRPKANMLEYAAKLGYQK